MAEHAAPRDTPPGGRPTDRPDLAAMLVPLCRALVDAERPVLDAHGLAMWAYSVLLHLDETPIRTQAALAEAIRADKTRIIPVLDDLEARGLIHRRPTRGPSGPAGLAHPRGPTAAGRRPGRHPARRGTAARPPPGRGPGRLRARPRGAPRPARNPPAPALVRRLSGPAPPWPPHNGGCRPGRPRAVGPDRHPRARRPVTSGSARAAHFQPPCLNRPLWAPSWKIGLPLMTAASNE